MTIRAVILGGTGYGGMELLRYLLGHPEIEVTALTSRSEDGPVADHLPHLRGVTDLVFTKEGAHGFDGLVADADLVFSARPHGVAAAELPGLLDRHAHLKAIDLSGDFRLKDATLYPRWYAMEHPHPTRLAEAVYGLPEAGDRESIREARLVSNPGCHATAVLLALLPLVASGLLAGRPHVVSVTGSSGSGAKPSAGTHHPERFSNFKAYKPLRHQHVAEIEQTLGGTRIDFVPCSAPIARGIHVTTFAPVGEADEEAVRTAFATQYATSPLVRPVPGDVEVRAVAGTSFADVSLVVREGTAVVNVAIDNLGKGMAGTAVQNANLMYGLEETTGLLRPGAGL
ncbi:MAG: N-acetyl-gamma-glutamyl-phosphate reductase [Planctomycetota bacterium]